MGMAASQARLLTLTARMHDVEREAQSVMAQKIALATQKDGLYQEYCEALDATSFKVAFWDDAAKTRYLDANFDSVCSYNQNRIKQYALRDNQTGKMIVSEETKRLYDGYGNDKYSFAWAMLGYEQDFAWNEGLNDRAMGAEIGVGKSQGNYGKDSDYGYTESLYMTQVEKIVYDRHCGTDTELNEKYNEIDSDAIKNDPRKQADALNAFRETLYSKYSSEIFEYMNLDKQVEKTTLLDSQNNIKESAKNFMINDKSWDEIRNEYNYYINLWTAIHGQGGCVTVDAQYQSGKEGNEWFKNMVESGLITIQVFNDESYEKAWNDTSFATSTNNNYLQEVQDDSELKKAETKYEQELAIINKKDARCDNKLTKLETERTAYKTEIESIKTVRNDNIDKTFSLFS